MISRNLWNANSDLKTACLQHPFVQGIATGSLPEACFRYYVGQDAFFLTAFARAYSIAAAKTPDWEGFTTFHSLGDGVVEELRLHQRYAAEWGVDLQQIQPGIATRRYTDFLLATAWGQDVGLTTAAMTPCLRLYAFLGQSLAQSQTSTHEYSDWIKTYNDAAFEQLAQQLEDLMSRYITHQETEASSIYRYAMECELDFFEAAWCSQKTG
ncbi:MAG: TenA family protein [Microcoleaceae cyanobacterium]